MDWSKVRAAVGTIAPWLAGTLGTPVAGVAVKALCDVFGLSGATATPDNVSAALAAATPAQLQELRAANDRHAEFMAQIGYDRLELLTDDRDSARKREIAIRDKTPAVLAWTVIAGYGAVQAFILLNVIPAEMREIIMRMLGTLDAAITMVLAYYFGSSAGSAKKDETIKGLTQ